jgi:hypothetical protein
MYGGVAIGWGLLADSQAELLDACQLSLHCGQAGSSVLDRFLHGGVSGAKVCKKFSVQHKQRVIVHSSHTVAMICIRDGCLVYQRNRVSPKLLEGLDQLNDWWALVFTSNSICVFLGVHAIALDDAQADVNHIMVLHRIACHACVQRANEEACHEGLETFGGMPVSGHLLSIILVDFGCHLAILCNEPVKHV